MKPRTTLSTFFLFAALLPRVLTAGIPVQWTADAYKLRPLEYDCYHGETLDLAASLTAYGEPIDLTGKTARLYWQTNGMESAWWTTNAEVRAVSGASNVLAATFRGDFDAGAKSVTGFIGIDGENYRAAFVLRFRPSPGFVPNVLPLPQPVIDFSKVVVLNPPWPMSADLAPATNYTDSATNAIASDVSRLSTSKADRVQGATSGNFAALDADGNLVDSGWDVSGIYAAFLPVEWAMDPASTFVGKAEKAAKLTNEDWNEDLQLEGHEGTMRWGQFNYMNGNFKPFAYLSELPVISATDETFSNAVLAVGLNIDTNSVAVLNEIAATFGDFPITGTATTVGGLLAALAAAVTWLKKKKIHKLTVTGMAAEVTAENGVAKLDDFFAESNSLLTGTIDAEIVEKGTAPDAHLEAPTDERLKLILADNTVAYDSAKALPYKLASAIGDRVVATMTLTAASTDITLPTIAANDTTVKDFILDVTNAYAVEGVATDAGINIPRTDFKLVTRDGESLTDVTKVKAGKSAFICFTQKAPVVVGGTTYPCWCVIQLPFGDPS